MDRTNHPGTQFTSLLALLVVVAACGGGAPPSPPPPIFIDPPTLATFPGGHQQFTSRKLDFTVESVTWTVDEGPAGGTVDVTGRYQAPSTAGLYHLRATAVANPAQSAVAAISVGIAGAGDVDAAFGNNGRVHHLVSVTSGGIIGVAVQADGRIVAVGTATDGIRHDVAVARYLASGALDPAFGVDGVALVQLPRAYLTANALALQPDGKILVAGVLEVWGSGKLSFGLVRLDQTGALDPSFGTGGVVTTDIGTDSDVATAMALQPDGKVVVVGSTNQAASAYDLAVVRFHPDGRLDTALGGTGIVRVAVSPLDDWANAVIIQADGKILVAGSAPALSARPSFLLARFSGGGALDATFGAGGIVTTDLSSTRACAVSAVRILPDSKLVAVGTLGDGGGQYSMLLARFDAAGSLDPGFGAGGVVTDSFTSLGGPGNDVALQADGRIVVAGWANLASPAQDAVFVVQRRETDGTLDGSFGLGGTSMTSFGLARAGASVMTLQPDGRILAAGIDNVSSQEAHFALVRYLASAPIR